MISSPFFYRSNFCCSITSNLSYSKFGPKITKELLGFLPLKQLFALIIVAPLPQILYTGYWGFDLASVKMGHRA
jgi:hypothetical protein